MGSQTQVLEMKTILRLFFGALMALPMLYALPASAEQAGQSAQATPKANAPAATPIIVAQRALTPEQKAKRKANRKANKKKPNAARNQKGNNPKARANSKANNPKAKANKKLRKQRKALQKRKAVNKQRAKNKKQRTKTLDAEQKLHNIKPPSAERQKQLRAQDAKKRLQKKKQLQNAKQRKLQRKDNALDARTRQLNQSERRLDARRRALNQRAVKRRKVQTRKIQRNTAALKRAQNRQQALRKQINTSRNRATRLKRRNNRLTRQRNWLLAQRRTYRRRTAWNNFRFRERARVVNRYRDRTLFAAFAGAAVGAAVVGSYYVYHNDGDRIYSWRARDAYVDDLNNGWTRHVVIRPDGIRVVTIRDANGFIVRRYRVYSGNRVVMLYDNQPRWWNEGDLIVDVAPVRYSGPGYIVEPSNASVDDVYDVVVADPVREIDRTYTLNQILVNRNLRDYMPRIDLDTINFNTGSSEIDESQLDTLDEVGAAMEAAIKENPDEVYLIEGHSDAVGDPEMNAVLSDERAAAVANALTQYYDIPPENLVTQGYGEDFLKVQTRGPERRNRRVAIRRITPLLASENDDIALDDEGNEIFESQ